MRTVEWRGEAISRVVLGTVQLGMDYGIANTRGKPDERRATEIIKTAWEAGIRHFDTAQVYGDSEAVLGRAFRALGIGDECRVSSKLSARLDSMNLCSIEDAIDQTLERLGVESLWALLLHDPRWLDQWDDGLGASLLRRREAGAIRHLGVSLNTVADAPLCLGQPDMEILQVPCNAWDRRASEQGIVEAVRGEDRLVCVRSIYLQGLLTLSPEAVARKLPAAYEASMRWHAFAKRHRMSPTELAVRYALTLGVPLVVGAESPQQLRETLRLAEGEPLSATAIGEMARVLDPVLSEDVKEPYQWSR